jgi:hypothetical protein
MPPREVLILAMTKMLSGICTAGFTLDPHPVTGLRWVRPVREHGTLLPGDMTYADGQLVRCDDVVELNLLSPRRDPPHVEDWVTDFVHSRPRLLRRLEGPKRARFLSQHIDKAPQEVLVQNSRSLCLVHPSRVWASFSLDSYSGKYEARMGFSLDGAANHPRATSKRGVSVTDLRWRALGRTRLGDTGGIAQLDHRDLLERLDAEDIYLAVGLSRAWQGECWPLVIGVHVVPDYQVTLDSNNP